MAAEDINHISLKSDVSQIDVEWNQEMERNQAKVKALQTKLMSLKDCVLHGSDENSKELDVLWQRVKISATVLKYLTLKARIMAVPDLAHAYCGIKQLDGVGVVDRNGVPLSRWSSTVDLSSFQGLDDEALSKLANRGDEYLDEHDGAFSKGLLNSVNMVTDVMEGLVKRVIMAESETAMEKEKVTLGQEEIKKKVLQVEYMSLKLEEMERFAVGTNSILNEMKQRVEDLVEETSRQRLRASENEQELTRVKQDFDSLKSYVTGLINVRETLLSSEKQFQTIERLFERLMEKTAQLENEKTQKEAQVDKLMEENVRLSALLDKKEAQLSAMNEQCKFMALRGSKF